MNSVVCQELRKILCMQQFSCTSLNTYGVSPAIQLLILSLETDRHYFIDVTGYIVGLFILNATEAGGQNERRSWSCILCVLVFDFMCCVWKKMI